MKSIFTGFFLFVASLLGCKQQSGDFKSLNVEEFETLLLSTKVQRLDVRTQAEYAEGHVPGSVNLNVLEEKYFTEMSDSLLDKTRPVALYCRSGRRSKRAAIILSGKGYEVYELAKGFSSWEAAGKPIEK